MLLYDILEQLLAIELNAGKSGTFILELKCDLGQLFSSLKKGETLPVSKRDTKGFGLNKFKNNTFVCL